MSTLIGCHPGAAAASGDAAAAEADAPFDSQSPPDAGVEAASHGIPSGDADATSVPACTRPARAPVVVVPWSGGLEGIEGAHPGSRLATRVLRDDEGLAVFLGFYDTLLETECDIRDAIDGVTRCLPPWIAPDPSLRDATCFGSLLQLPHPRCAAPPYVDLRNSTGTLGVVPILGPAEPREQRAGACVPWSGAPISGCAFAFGAVVPPGDFVALTVREETRGNGDAASSLSYADASDGAWGFLGAGCTSCTGDTVIEGSGRLQHVRLRFADGTVASMFPTHLHDRQLGIDCAPARAGDGELRCLPLLDGLIPYAGVFLDAACSVQGAVRNPGGLFESYAVTLDESGCDDLVHVFPIEGTPLPTSMQSYRRDESGNCVPNAPDTTGDTALVGPEVMPASFAKLRVSVERD